MSKKKICLLIILCVLLLAICVFAFIQRNNIRSVAITLSHTESELAEMQEQSAETLVEKFGLTLDEVREKAEEISQNGEQFVFDENGNILNAEPLPDEKDGESKKQEKKPEKKEDKKEKKEEEKKKIPEDVQKMIAQLYLLQSQYVGQLQSIEGAAVSEFRSLPDSEVNTANAVKIGSKYVGQASALESACDSQVSSLVLRIRMALIRADMDTSVVDEIEKYYNGQKALMKAQLLSKYKKYLA